MYICTQIKYRQHNMQISIESLNLLMLNVGLAQHNGDWNWSNVNSPFTRIYYVTQGSARLHMEKSVIELRPGYLYIIPAHTVHSYECDGIFTHYYLHVYEGYKNETDIFDFYEFPIEVKADSLYEELFALMCSTHPEAALPASDPTLYDNNKHFIHYVNRYKNLPLHEKLQLRGTILMLLSQFFTSATPKQWTEDERMSKVLKYIHDHIYEDISIDTLASLACVTKSHLIRLFSQVCGVSPLQYINQKKIERAQLLLITDDIQVKELAYKLGFNDHSYFIRTFKKYTNTSPQAYRTSIK